MPDARYLKSASPKHTYIYIHIFGVGPTRFRSTDENSNYSNMVQNYRFAKLTTKICVLIGCGTVCRFDPFPVKL